jgi:hypothetical protein
MSPSILSRCYNYFNKVTSEIPYITFSVSFGLMVDMATYGIMVPVLPFRLESTGYKNVPATSSYRKHPHDDYFNIPSIEIVMSKG